MKGRPKKNGVDYFPHLVKHGETMFFLEKQFGNDGYAAWFKILETLGGNPGHYINCDGNSHHWEYLKAKTNLEEQKLTAIVELLAKLGAIDQDLWNDNRVIWSDNFISRLSYVYAKRNAEIPQKPIFCDRKPSQVEFPSQPETENRQEKRREVKRSKERVGADALPLIPTKEDISESAIPKVKDDVFKLMDTLYREKIFPDAPKFRNTMLKKKVNPRAILHALVRCYTKRPDPKEAWGYCLEVIKDEDGNYNERDATKAY